MDFAAFRLTDDERLQLLAVQSECTVGWLNSDGSPVSAFLTYVFQRDAFWVTSFRDRPRVACLVADPRSTVAVSSAGKPLPHGRMISARTLAVVHDDVSTAEWFYPRFCTMAGLDPAVLARQDRVIIELRPQAWNSFDGQRMLRR
ncbi:hypothetical protein [Mycobacterium terramassiliense]|uniref:Pyridoxamine 5'-phosphate oxidase putative domain-containing protein n=1 Tax=Mycobacterium terramassiliense TaxID=1841859 RepID=A0A2U3NJ74_9MYCO|nr:hypothetical protein [Mycobacterium terramassiliense]SPM31540.1 hypothetical protein MTAB308_5059 [Mycobacterium terramassiliense]